MTRHVVTVKMDDPISHVRALFARFHFHHVLVIDDGKVVGVVSDRDLLRQLSPRLGTMAEKPADRDTLTKRVHQVMSRSVVAVQESTPMEEAGLLMLRRDISCLPVLDDEGRCRGILTSRDLMRWCLQGCCAARSGASKAA